MKMDSNIFEVKSWERCGVKCWKSVLRNRTLFSLVLVLILCKFAEADKQLENYGHNCDWSGSGLDLEHRGVTPIYLSCTGGQVTWTYPRGALRILLRLPPTENAEFKTCIKLHGDPNVVRVFLEGQRSLHALQVTAGSNQVRCFQSKKQQVALYVEATNWKPLTKHVVQLEYDLQPLPESVTYQDPFEECRPCSSEELIHAFCTSELVTRGIIKGVHTGNGNEETSQLQVRVTKLIRHIPTDTNDNEIQIDHNSKRKTRSVQIHVASQCDVSHGTGEFVFMARRRLGDLTIRCAPRLEDWIKIVQEQGLDHCILNS